MAREENSLLFSLKGSRQHPPGSSEGRGGHPSRCHRGGASLKEDAIRRAREEEEAKIRAAEDTVRREREEKNARSANRIRLEEAERRAYRGRGSHRRTNPACCCEAIRSKPLPVKLIAAVIIIIGGVHSVQHRGCRQRQSAPRKRQKGRSPRPLRASSQRKKDRDETARLQKALTDRLTEAKQLEDQVNAARAKRTDGAGQAEPNRQPRQPRATGRRHSSARPRKRDPAKPSSKALQERRRPALWYLSDPAPSCLR